MKLKPKTTDLSSRKLSGHFDCSDTELNFWKGSGVFSEVVVHRRHFFRYDYILTDHWDGWDLGFTRWGAESPIDVSSFQYLRIGMSCQKEEIVTVSLEYTRKCRSATVRINMKSSRVLVDISMESLVGGKDFSLDSLSLIVFDITGKKPVEQCTSRTCVLFVLLPLDQEEIGCLKTFLQMQNRNAEPRC